MQGNKPPSSTATGYRPCPSTDARGNGPVSSQGNGAESGFHSTSNQIMIIASHFLTFALGFGVALLLLS